MKSAIRVVNTYLFIVLLFQLLFYNSGITATYLEVDVAEIGLWFSNAYCGLLSLVSIYFLLMDNSPFKRKFVPGVIASIVMSFFSPNVAAVFLSILAIGSALNKPEDNRKDIISHIVENHDDK